MDKLKEKLNTLRTEADASNARADQTEAELKKSEQSLAGKDNEVAAVKNKVALLESELQRVQLRIQQLNKNASAPTSPVGGDSDKLMTRISAIEQQTDEADARLKSISEGNRHFEVVCEQQERQAAQIDMEVNQLRQKCGEAQRQYQVVQNELDQTLKQFEEFA